MASAGKDSKGWRIRFIDHQGKRRTLRPGKATKRAAEQVATYLDDLVAAKTLGQPVSRQVALWLSETGDSLHGKLARIGLVEARAETALESEHVKLLSELLEEHVYRARTSKGTVAARSTVLKWKGTQRFLNERFTGRTVSSMTKEDAHQFCVWLESRRIKKTSEVPSGQPMAENARRKHIANCKMFFNAAIKRGLIGSNPFEDQISGSTANRSRDYYVCPEQTQKLLKAASDAQWKLMIALWRLAGLRKMEIFDLKWGDVKWNDGKLVVRSSKTEHVEGCEMRFVPLRDVGQYFRDAYDEAATADQSDASTVITRFTATNSNLDKPFRKIIKSAGLTPWPKLFQNLRASCETQWLKEGTRPDLAANWIGHSVKVQRQNYVQETDEDIENFNSSRKWPICGPDDAGTEKKVARLWPASKTRKHWLPVFLLLKQAMLITPGGT